MDEIVEIYKKQLQLYQNIKGIFLNLKSNGDDQSGYDSKLKEINFILDNIRSLGERAEQLKQIYILKHNLSDFIGEEIKRVEDPQKYESLKKTVDELSLEIKAVKRLQDEVVNRINKIAEESWQKLKEFNNSKKNFDNYDKSYKSRHENLIDTKK